MLILWEFLEMGRKATAMWYDESKNYDFSKGESKTGGEAVDEFTQMVWKKTTSFGCGLATDSEGRNFYAVARYTPVGNKGDVEEYKSNVLSPLRALKALKWPFVD